MLKLIQKSGLFWTKLNLPTINNSTTFLKYKIKKKGLLSITLFKLNFNKLTLALSFFIRKNMKILFVDYNNRSFNIIKKFAKNLDQFFVENENPIDLATNFNISWSRFKKLNDQFRSYYKNFLTEATFNINNNKIKSNHNIESFFKNAPLNQFVDSFFFFSENNLLKKQVVTNNFITFSILNLGSSHENNFYFIYSNKNSRKMLISLLFLLESQIKQKVFIKNLLI